MRWTTASATFDATIDPRAVLQERLEMTDFLIGSGSTVVVAAVRGLWGVIFRIVDGSLDAAFMIGAGDIRSWHDELLHRMLDGFEAVKNSMPTSPTS